jgi:hypothetical protein
MKPTEANFDGAKGICLNNPHMPDGGVYKLRRGFTSPSGDCRNQLLWQMTVDADSRLLYCDNNDNWYELSFTPIEKP